jgi:hypothetical protein
VSGPTSTPKLMRRRRRPGLTARPALDALADELVAHEMVDSRRLDEILVQAGFTPAPANDSGVPALAGVPPA